MSYPSRIRATTVGIVLSAMLALLSGHANGQAPGDVDPTFNVDNQGAFNNHGVVPYVGHLRHGPNGTFWATGIATFDDRFVGPICRMYPDASFDTSFFMSTSYAPRCFEVQSDGRVIVGYSGLLRRYSADGSWGTDYSISVDGVVLDLALQADGKVIMAGTFDTWNGQWMDVDGLVRLDTNGVRDPSFDPYLSGIVFDSHQFYDVLVRPDGTILALGDFEINMPGTNVNSIGFVALHPDGTLNEDLTPTGTGMPGFGSFVELRPWLNDGRLLMINGGTSFEDTPVSRIFLLDTLGNLDLTVLPTLGDTVFTRVKHPVRDCAIYPDGRMLFVGDPPDGAPLDHIPMVRVYPNGVIDTTFHPQDLFNGPEPANIESVLIGEDGSIYCGGLFSRAEQGAYRNGLMKLDSLGNLDPLFMVGNGFNGPVFDVVQLPDARYVVGGDFTTYRGRRCRGIACLTTSGELDSTFQIGTGFSGPLSVYSLVTALTVQPDGRILVAGDFTSYNGTPRTDLLRLEPDGTLDTLFDPFGPGSTYLNWYAPQDVAVQPDGKVLVSGSLGWSGFSAQGIARYFPNGTRDTSFDHGVGFSTGPNSLSIQPSGKIVCGGIFTSYAGAPCEYRCCRLNTDGSLDGTFFIPGSLVINFDVNQVLSQPDGKVLLSGPFNYIGGHTTYHIGRMNANGSPDVSFSAPWGAGTPFTLQADGRIISGSAEYDGVVQQGVVRMFSNSDWDPSFGQPDSTWNDLTDDVVTALFIDSEERVLVGGDFRRMRGQSANGLVRLYTDFSTAVPQGQEGSDGLNVWPNPSSGVFNIALPWIGTSQEAILEVVNTLGQRVHAQRIGKAKGQLQLDLSQHTRGAYTVRIIDNWGVATVRLVRE